MPAPPPTPAHVAREKPEQLPGAEPAQTEPSLHPDPHAAGEHAAGDPPQDPLPWDQTQPVWMPQLISSENPAHGAGDPVQVRIDVQNGAAPHGDCTAQGKGTPEQTSICSQFIPT